MISRLFGKLLCAFGEHDYTMWEVAATQVRDSTKYERQCRRAGCDRTETFTHVYGGPMADPMHRRRVGSDESA